MFKTASLAASLLLATARESELFLMKEALEEYEASTADEFGSLATNLEDPEPSAEDPPAEDPPAEDKPTEDPPAEDKKPAETPAAPVKLPKGSKWEEIAIYNGCMAEANYQVFNLKMLEKAAGITSKNPHSIFYTESDDTRNLFQFGICQPEYDISKADSKQTVKENRISFDSTLGAKKGDGVLGKLTGSNANSANDYTAKQTFGNPLFSAYLPNKAGKYQGFQLQFTSTQKCAADTSKDFTFYLYHVCDATKTNTAFKYNYQRALSSDPCVEVFTYEGPEGCAAYDLGAIRGYLKFAGALEIFAGLVLCFYGSAILIKALGFLCFLGIFTVVMGLGNVFVDYYSGSVTPLVIFAVLGAIGGAVGTFFFVKVADAWGTSLLALLAGGMCALIVLTPLGFLPSWAKYILLVLAAVGAAAIGKTYNEELKAYGTAIIGAGMVIHGLGQYIGGFPAFSSPKELKADWGYLGYFVGFLVLTAGGVTVQNRYLQSKANDAFNEL